MSIHLNYYNYWGNYIWLGINYLYFKDKKKYWKLWKNVLFLLHFSKDLYSRKDMNLARFNIVPIVQFRWRCACLDQWWKFSSLQHFTPVVKPVYSGHLGKIDKMTTIYRWPLYEGFDYSTKYFTLIVNKRL
jgi:hypothetical protein